MAKSLRELSKQRQKFKEIKGKDKRGGKKVPGQIRKGRGREVKCGKKRNK